MLTTGQHTLTTQPDNNESYKHCILVKLTDSSAKAIEEYLRNGASINRKPCIKFQKDKGELSFPILSKAADGGPQQYKKFHFGLSSVKESNQSASFECISYSDSKLATIGNIEQKLAIQANVEESFKDTKEKLVNIVAEEEKKNALIELKPFTNPINRSKQNGPNSFQSTTTTVKSTLASNAFSSDSNKQKQASAAQLAQQLQQQQADRSVMMNKAKNQSLTTPLPASVAKNKISPPVNNYNNNKQNINKNNNTNYSININSKMDASNSLGSGGSPDSDDLLNDREASSLSSFAQNHSNTNNKKPLEKENHQQQTSSLFSTNKKQKLTNHNNDNVETVNAADESNQLELSRKYTKIVSSKQLEQYKSDFDQTYNEYLELHNYIESVSRKFMEHKAEIEKIADKTSKEFKEKERKILIDYIEKQQEPDYLKNKKRHDSLFNKLNYIQDLIKQYKPYS